ncbi:L-rhamnose mutarotase [Sinomicrobium soli]|uniref:L-rhamnose mutarotase n=1 Tax=Sinomicrobium sp. N-1-3-6 TaxID=2219864 RepID=UPI000DCE9B72|nr:L-rhamnose mutarotase [Sinomicrobium sp. N-1-3-6]RAV30356.1 L-fucose mutarotase [Sinomicrobium sp. N-1-3-6]
MKKYCLALDLKPDKKLIAAYEEHHRQVWPEVLRNICQCGIINMEIYRMENRLCMIMETDDGFTFEQKEALDAATPRVQEWEKLMWKYQQAIPNSKPGEKWRVMTRIFDFKEAL